MAVGSTAFAAALGRGRQMRGLEHAEGLARRPWPRSRTPPRTRSAARKPRWFSSVWKNRGTATSPRLSRRIVVHVVVREEHTH